MTLPREQRLLLTVGLGTLAYAVLRYHIIKNVPWEHLPLYTTNKVFAVVGLAGLVGSRLAAGRERRQSYGFAGLLCTTVHVLMSLLLLFVFRFICFLILLLLMIVSLLLFLLLRLLLIVLL